ncbi:MAG: SMP-30/gluconolactonase/LRE family protein [Blastocatellia bacterium]|nr:SMP-30/gluconolactonase/LRE family protein [Blastocatellia bacterium]
MNPFVTLRRLTASAVLLGLLGTTTGTYGQTGQEDVAKSRGYYRKAVQCYQEKNWPGFLENMEKAQSLRPNHPNLLLGLAKAFTVNQKHQEALAALKKLAVMGVNADLAKEAAFSPLAGESEFANLRQAFENNQKPVGTSVVAGTIPEKQLVTESVAWDAATKRFFVSSVHKRKILTLDAKGEVHEFTTEGQDGLWSVLGLRVDAKRRLLWACSAALPQMKGFESQEEGKAGVFAYDLTTGKLKRKWVVEPANGSKHAFGDLTISQNGTVWISDSTSPNLYRIGPDLGEIEAFVTNGPFESLQGMALSRDEKYLFFADYSIGLFRLEVKTKQIQPVMAPPGQTLIGLDGVYEWKGNLLVTQNGIAPNRVLRLELNSDQTAVKGLQVLEANTPRVVDLTLGTIAGNDFFFIGNAQWSHFDQKNQIFPAEKFEAATILKLALPK